MSLVTDLDYLVHRLRISQLRLEDRVAGRMMRFNSTTISLNDYIRTTSTSYPEMVYCSSPDIIPGLPEGGPLTSFRQLNNNNNTNSNNNNSQVIQVTGPTPPPSRTRSSSTPKEHRTGTTSTTVDKKSSASKLDNNLSPNSQSLLRHPTSTSSNKPPELGQTISLSKSVPNLEELTDNITRTKLVIESTGPDSIVSPASTSVSTAASSPYVAPSMVSVIGAPLNLLPPTALLNPGSSLPTVISEEYRRQPQHQRMLSAIPELSLQKATPPSQVDSDEDEDDDIELDYDEVTKEAKKAPNVRSRHPPLKSTERTDPTAPARPVIPRKFSQANVASPTGTLIMTPGVVYPKSRMRSLSGSSVNQTNSASNRSTGASSTATSGQTTPQESPDVRSKPRTPLAIDTSELPVTIKPPSGVSMLTAMIAAKKPVMDNPFLGEFAGFTGQGELAPLALQLYLPHSNTPNKPLDVLVRRDATVENVIGFALYTYYDQHWQPPLTPQQSKTSQWTMRIVEDDGSIDEDFPALERTRQIEKFAFDQFALCEVSPAQAKANEMAQVRTPRETTSPTTSKPASSSVRKTMPGIPISEVSSKSSVGPSTDAGIMNLVTSGNSGPLQMIKIQLFNHVGVLHTTTLNVATSTSLVAIKAAVCRKWNLISDEYELTSSQSRHALDKNATLEGLLGITELSLVKRSTSMDLHSMTSRTPPMGSLSGPYAASGLPFIYRHYTVYRRMPMFVNKQERVLAIDGYYLHILPPAGRGGPGGIGGSGFGGGSLGAYASTKTSSYHIGALELCSQGRKVRRRLKLVFTRSHDSKTYDFEATSQDEADEICTNLNFLLHTYRGEKHSLLPPPST